MADKTLKIRVHGRVQGVFFRHHTKQMADALGLSGWVRNCADGSVEALCCGSTDALEQLVDWLHLGPESAVVNQVDIDELDEQRSAHLKFTIRY